VHPTGGSRRVFEPVSWLEVGAVKMAFSRPTHQRVTQTVGLLRDHKMKKTLMFSLLMTFIVACAPQRSAPTSTSLPVSPTYTVTVIPTQTNTPVILPTETPTPKPPDQILNSPNSEYIAEFDNAYSHPAFAPQVIQILDKNGFLLWEIPYQHEIFQSDPHPSLRIYGWSVDSNYLYFYYASGPDGGDFAFWWDGFDLQRINVENGEIEQVISGDREGNVAFAFSPDGTQLAYTREQDDPSVIYIHNLSSGKEKTTKVITSLENYRRVGDFHWSPSGREIAFQTEAEDYMAQTIVLSLSTMKQKVIREYLVGSTYFQGWSDDGNLEFFDVEIKVAIVHVNPQSGETIVIGTPTPGS
jgi:dipeptidyl aminopeptidase/acylaminoacyl peptidase